MLSVYRSVLGAWYSVLNVVTWCSYLVSVGKRRKLEETSVHMEHRKECYDQFNIHTPPDITSRTRIISVLGVLDDVGPAGDEGWFVSDYFAFWNLFQGYTENQTWYHCLDLDDLVRKHGRYLHGNSYRQGKVVLDAAILAKSKKSRHAPQHIKAQDLKMKIKGIITAECKAAEKAKENLLILFFGHGDVQNHGIILGLGHRPTLKIQEFKSATKAFQVSITMVTTSCYSGGWTCHPELNISTMTAAGNENVSLSWRFSGSSGRACGSMFTTALVQKLTKVGATGKSLIMDEDEDEDEDKEETEDQIESYAEFTRTVHEHLLMDVDRRGYEHNITFGAQDDAWNMCWRQRTGIPLGRFKERWETLEDWEKDATLHPGDPMNRDPSVTEEQRAEYLQLRPEASSKGKQTAAASGSADRGATGSVLGKRKTSGLHGGTDNALKGMVSRIGAEYLQSYQGFEDSGDDGYLHHIVRWIQDGREVEMDRVEGAYRALSYRMTQMSTADKYLEIMNIPAPKGQLCCEFDTWHMRRQNDWADERAILRKLIFERKVLFPRPIAGQGRPFYKGVDYLIAAFHFAGISKEDVIKKLDVLAKTIDQSLEREKEAAKQDPEVSSKRRKLFHSFGISFGEHLSEQTAIGGSLNNGKRLVAMVD